MSHGDQFGDPLSCGLGRNESGLRPDRAASDFAANWYDVQPAMNQIDPEHFYSIFSEEDGVVLYDCLKHAEDAKTDWEQDTWVAGPFEHSRIEKDLVRGAQSALRVLTRVRARMNDADLAPGVDLAIRQLKDGLASYFPPE